jgi:hypothetical protein
VVAGFTFTMEEWLTVGEELAELGLDAPAPSAFPYDGYELSFGEPARRKKRPADGWRARQAKKRAQTSRG